jgi:hypothetical protein
MLGPDREWEEILSVLRCAIDGQGGVVLVIQPFGSQPHRSTIHSGDAGPSVQR